MYLCLNQGYLWLCSYRVERSAFDHGVGCIVRADEQHFRETQLSVRKVALLSDDGEVAFEHAPHEELVSNVIEISGDIDQNVSDVIEISGDIDQNVSDVIKICCDIV